MNTYLLNKFNDTFSDNLGSYHLVFKSPSLYVLRCELRFELNETG